MPAAASGVAGLDEELARSEAITIENVAEETALLKLEAQQFLVSAGGQDYLSLLD